MGRGRSRWLAPVLAAGLWWVTATAAEAKYTLVDSGWVSNHTIGIMWDSYEEIYDWSELGPFHPFEDQFKQATDLQEKFKTGQFKAILLHVSMRNDSGKPLNLGYDVGDSGFCDASGQFWLGGADGSACDSTGWAIGNNAFGHVSSAADLTSFIPDGMPRRESAKPGDIVRGKVVMFFPRSFVPSQLYVHTGPGHQWGTEPLTIKLRNVSAATSEPSPASAAPPVANAPEAGAAFPPISGTWVGDGAVLFLSHELGSGGPVSLAGFWLKPGGAPNRDGIALYLEHGQLDLATGSMTFTYTPPGATQPVLGHFQIGADGRSLQAASGDAGMAKLWRRESLKDALDSTDRAVVYGIYFDPVSGKLKPESQPALLEMARLLHDTPVGLRIEVYGDDTAQTQKQADAIKAYLMDQYRIGVNRIDAVGCGTDRPMAEGDEGRLLNHRVEVVKQP